MHVMLPVPNSGNVIIGVCGKYIDFCTMQICLGYIYVKGQSLDVSVTNTHVLVRT